jgi:hypothetical protein
MGGGAPPAPPNAQAFQMDAALWIETMEYEFQVPPMPLETPPMVLPPMQTNRATPLQPGFVAANLTVAGKWFASGIVKVATTQFQFSQKGAAELQRPEVAAHVQSPVWFRRNRSRSRPICCRALMTVAPVEAGGLQLATRLPESDVSSRK